MDVVLESLRDNSQLQTHVSPRYARMCVWPLRGRRDRLVVSGPLRGLKSTRITIVTRYARV